MGWFSALPSRGGLGGDGVWFWVFGFSVVFLFWGFCEDRLTSVCVSSAIHGGRLLSFACPKESNQRKDTLASAVTRASCPRDSASRLRGPLTAHPCAEIGRVRILRAPLRAVSSTCSPRPRGAREEPERGSPCRRSPTSPLSRLRERARVRAALGSPLRSGEGRTEKPRAPHAGGARDRADFGLQAMDGLWAEPVRPQRTARCASGADPRVPFSWLLLFGQAKRSNRPPWMADEMHTDVSRLLR